MTHPNSQMANAYAKELCGTKPSITLYGRGYVTFELTAAQLKQARESIENYFGGSRVESWIKKTTKSWIQYDKWEISSGRFIELRVDNTEDHPQWKKIRTLTLLNSEAL